MRTPQQVNLKAKALALLARRDYAYAELQQKLQRYSCDLEQITLILDELVRQNLLNEERFISNFAASKSQKYGSQKIRYLLKQKVADPELIREHYQPEFASELANAKQVWSKKFAGTVATERSEISRQINFLLRRGFSLEVARQIVAKGEN